MKYFFTLMLFASSSFATTLTDRVQELNGKYHLSNIGVFTGRPAGDRCPEYAQVSVKFVGARAKLEYSIQYALDAEFQSSVAWDDSVACSGTKTLWKYGFTRTNETYLNHTCKGIHAMNPTSTGPDKTDFMITLLANKTTLSVLAKADQTSAACTYEKVTQ